jgi:hypothetical protein
MCIRDRSVPDNRLFVKGILCGKDLSGNHVADMDDQVWQGAVFVPEVAYADGCLVKIRMKYSGYGFTVRGEMGEAEGKGYGNGMVCCLLNLFVVVVEPLDGICHLKLFRWIAISKPYCNMWVCFETFIKFIKDRFKLSGRDAHRISPDNVFSP